MTTSLARGSVASSHERALLLAAQRGDARAQEELLRRYEPIVIHVVRRLRLPRRCERADIAQEARIALLGAIRAWQPRRGPFAPFAVRCVRTKTATALSSARTHKHQLLGRASSLHYSPASGVTSTPLEDLTSGKLGGARRRSTERPADTRAARVGPRCLAHFDRQRARGSLRSPERQVSPPAGGGTRVHRQDGRPYCAPGAPQARRPARADRLARPVPLSIACLTVR